MSCKRSIVNCIMVRIALSTYTQNIFGKRGRGDSDTRCDRRRDIYEKQYNKSNIYQSNNQEDTLLFICCCRHDGTAPTMALHGEGTKESHYAFVVSSVSGRGKRNECVSAISLAR